MVWRETGMPNQKRPAGLAGIELLRWNGRIWRIDRRRSSDHRGNRVVDRRLARRAIGSTLASATRSPEADVASSATPVPTAVPTPTPEPTPRSATIRALGEISMDLELLQSAVDLETSTFDFSPMFSEIADVVGDADYTIADVEGTLGDTMAFPPPIGAMYTPSALLTTLKDSGVTCSSSATTHAMDGPIQRAGGHDRQRRGRGTGSHRHKPHVRGKVDAGGQGDQRHQRRFPRLLPVALRRKRIRRRRRRAELRRQPDHEQRSPRRCAGSARRRAEVIVAVVNWGDAGSRVSPRRSTRWR